MPSPYIIKRFLANGIYHVYNRGVNKQEVFVEDIDYKFFLSLLKSYLLPAEIDDKEKQHKQLRIKNGQFSGKIDVLAYALMPNHYHLLLKQKGEHDLSTFMKSLMNTYVSYFNRKYKRVGPLFQGTYKAILLENDSYLLHLSRYIHLNPINNRGDLSKNSVINQYTSYGDYLDIRNTRWLNKKVINSYFEQEKESIPGDIEEYKNFVEDLMIDEKGHLGIYAID